MPAWHGGLISNVLASCSVGATVVSAKATSSFELWELIKEFRPTWLPLPVDLAKQILGDERIFLPYGNSLRFVRLSKASLRKQEISVLESVFKCPVLSSYGMTEAASGPVACETIACRRPGSVGKPVHLEVKLDHEHVLIRGPSVMKGYISGPSDSLTFTDDGWLRTGDLGRYDEDGFLYLTGRTAGGG
jgi:long-subunit acyl-CoA synthetase (AMP-forming)